MKSLVTGASGFVGQHLVEHLRASEIEVVATGSQEANPFTDGDVEYIPLDLIDQEKVDKAIDFAKIDRVFHLAGLAAVGPSFDNPQLYMDTNLGLQRSLFEAAKAQDQRPRFVIVSSGSVYDGNQSMPITESSRVAPNSPYSESKLAQEELAGQYVAAGFEAVIARPFNHIGPGQLQGFLVADLAKQVVEVERGERANISVGNIKTKRDYTDVRDIVGAYALLATDGVKGEIYNVCSGESTSGEEILRKLGEIAGVHLNFEIDESKLRKTDIADIYGDARKLHEATGWKPELPLDQTLEDVLEFWRQR